MATANNNHDRQLVKGGSLPVSMVEFVDVKEDHKVVYIEDDLQEFMKDINNNFWQDAKELKKTFKLPAGTLPRQRVARQVNLAFPYCLLATATELHERLIVVNWWLNLNHDSQKEKYAFLKTKFDRPRASTIRTYEYNKDDPRYQGVADNLELRKKAAKESRSWEILEGGRKRKSQSAAARTDRQVRDRSVLHQQDMVEKNFRQLCNRSAVDPSVADQVNGFMHPMTSLLYNVATPHKNNSGGRSGRPSEKTKPTIFTTPVVQRFTRNEESLKAQASHLNRQICAVSNHRLGTPVLMQALQNKTKIYYAEDKEKKWPSEQRTQENTNPAGNLPPPVTETEAAQSQTFDASNLSDVEED